MRLFLFFILLLSTACGLRHAGSNEKVSDPMIKSNPEKTLAPQPDLKPVEITLTKKILVLDEDHVLERLGEPTLRRSEGDVSVFVYAKPKCTLFVYLKGRVKHMEIGDPSALKGEKDSSECLRFAKKLR